jgi:hypothetical protein
MEKNYRQIEDLVSGRGCSWKKADKVQAHMLTNYRAGPMLSGYVSMHLAPLSAHQNKK